jgi:tetratricopeptide (TPR) repeat protein
LNDLLESDPAEFGRKDLALLNVLCAPNLAGSERLDIQRCLFHLDRLVAHVKATTERNLHRFPQDPEYGQCEPKWRMAMLVTCVKLDFGVAYDPVVKADLDRDGRSPFIDSRNVFIHGLLDDDPKRRWGSCSSIPVLVAAVARRLGYPVGLAVNRRHVYARWDGGGDLAFNVEASNAAGMTIHSDEYYRNEMCGPMTPAEVRSGFYGRSLWPAEEFALFLKNRVWCLCDMARYEQTLLWSARALQFAPEDPHFAKCAYELAILAIKHRVRQKHPTRAIPAGEDEFAFNLDEFTSVPERSLFLAIAAHTEELDQNLDKARELYEDACRMNPYGNNEQRDLQRFLRKHDLAARRPGPVLPPRHSLPRFFNLPNAAPDRQAAVLLDLADEFECKGELLKARKALIDLYMFDPCDAELYHRLRAIENRPKFQEQLKEDLDRRGQKIRPAPAFPV